MPNPTLQIPQTWGPTAFYITETPTTAILPTLRASIFEQISPDSMLTFLDDLTAIHPHTGWRNSGTQGEAQALDYVGQTLDEYTFLKKLGIEQERQVFPVYLATELWQAGLTLRINREVFQVPADGLRGSSFSIQNALTFDSDGKLNDRDRNPLKVSGSVLLASSEVDYSGLNTSEITGKIILIDYSLVDTNLQDRQLCIQRAEGLLRIHPAGLVLVTHNSYKLGESHGTFASEGGVFQQVENPDRVPIISVRLEDLSLAGIQNWDDLTKIDQVELAWDADVFSPGQSGNLVVRIPGIDTSQAMILGAHIDSPNNPGALDDGSGSVILMEIARVLNKTKTQPPVDLYLTWFGSEELLLLGSSYFVATHQDLLDRTIAALTVDDLSHPIQGVHASLNLYTWSPSRVGEDGPAFAEYLSLAASRYGVETTPIDRYTIRSDNNVFAGFGVPNADLILIDDKLSQQYDKHYLGHTHDPYDTVELVREMSQELVQMVKVALSAALDAPLEATDLLKQAPAQRAVFLGIHNEFTQMSPAAYNEFGMALEEKGLDVDLLPYGHALTTADLIDAILVVVLPACDIPDKEGATEGLYDTSWSSQEIDILETYVQDGGLLLLTNSSTCTDMLNSSLAVNEDAQDMNDLAGRFGIHYLVGNKASDSARIVADSPLLEGVISLDMQAENAIPMETLNGKILAITQGKPALVLVEFGDQGGQVLALADVSMLGPLIGRLENVNFWINLAMFATSR